jgi:hypothetical protein
MLIVHLPVESSVSDSVVLVVDNRGESRPPHFLVLASSVEIITSIAAENHANDDEEDC